MEINCPGMATQPRTGSEVSWAWGPGRSAIGCTLSRNPSVTEFLLPAGDGSAVEGQRGCVCRPMPVWFLLQMVAHGFPWSQTPFTRWQFDAGMLVPGEAAWKGAALTAGPASCLYKISVKQTSKAICFFFAFFAFFCKSENPLWISFG